MAVRLQAARFSPDSAQLLPESTRLLEKRRFTIKPYSNDYLCAYYLPLTLF
jgi:hypothetical protein